MKLSEINQICAALKTAKTEKIKLLHKFIFDADSGRQNRTKLRQFEGFEFRENDADFEAKLKNINETFTLIDLITICNIIYVPFEGTKAEVSSRILTSLCDISQLAESIKNECSNSSDLESDDEHESDSQGRTCGSQTQTSARQSDCHDSYRINFSDIETMIAPFCAEAHENINSWIEQFELTSKLFNLNEIQKVVFAKRLMRKNALLFINSELTLTSWDKLKTALVSEFAEEVNSAKLHTLLNSRRIKEGESVLEYFFKLKEIASRGKIEDAALIQYVIKGLGDKSENKLLLYGSKNLNEFKEKLKVYESVRNEMGRNKINYDRVKSRYENSNRNKNDYEHHEKNKQKYCSKETKNTSDSQNTKVCFNCGAKGHISKFCVHKNKGLKCFRCSSFGHKASDCPTAPTRNEVASISAKAVPNMTKIMKIGNVEVDALVDTGSQVTLLRKSIFDKLKVKNSHSVNSTLTGFGQLSILPCCVFQSDIFISDFKCSTDIYVVYDQFMPYDAILGYDIIKQGVSIIDECGFVITNRPLENENNNNFSVLTILDVKAAEINIEPSIPKIFKDKIHKLILEYKPCKTKSTDIDLKILVKKEEPIFHQPRRLPFSEKKVVEKQVAEWIEQGIVEPSSSEYASPVVIVKKKDGSPRVCIDFRRLNKIVVKDRFPLPLIEDILDRLQEARVFSTLDLKNGFFHVDVHPDSRKYTSFVTHEGQYQYLKVPFGYCNSPAAFQRFINKIFRPLVNAGILLPYMDDLIILAANEEEGIERVEQVLNLAKDYGLEINFKKSHFLKRRIEFLGHLIEAGTISPSPAKTKAVMSFPEPKNLKQVQSYLGLTGYFRKFISQYSLIAKPLSDLLRKDNKFKFDIPERNAFNKLKSMLSEKPVLSIYNPNFETEVHTDASLDGYGAILLQKSPNDHNFHPTYYMSRKTTDAEKKYSSYELEVLAVIEALKKFRVYLLGIPFKIVTDCAAFQKTMDKRDLSTRVARWVLLLAEFNYTIEHRSGTKMTHVDALSRSPINTYCILFENILPKLKLAQSEDNEIKAIKEILKTSNYDNYCVRNEILYKFIDGKELLVIPENMQSEIIKNAHEKGHMGIKHTEKNLSDRYFIPKLKHKIEKIIANCVHCILINRKKGKQEGFLHPIHKDDLPLSTYHIDHLGPLESTHKNYKYILAIIDGFTKFVWLYPTKTTSSAEVLSKLELQKITFGNPKRIISDRGTAFTSKEFEEYCSKEDIQHHLITTGLPRSNGQVERLNQVIISMIAKLSLNDSTKWYMHVSKIQQVINSSYHSSINTTPFELLFGTKINSKEDADLTQLLNTEFQKSFENSREDLRKDAKQQILKIQESNRKSYNLRRKHPHEYKLNDLVAIKRTQFGPHLKLKPRFFGPYKVVKIKPNETYDLEKCGTGEGASKTSSCAEFMKPWISM